MDMIVFLNVKPEDHDNFALALSKVSIETGTDSETKKTKTRSEINHQNYERRKAKQSEQSEIQTEEKRDEKRDEEGFSPLTPPLPFSPNTPYPIPLISPLSQEAERKGERKERAIAAPKPVKSRYGNFSHVLLTDDEHQKLCEKFPHNVGERIQNLDDYLENNRKKHYDNHYLTILNWARKDEQKPQFQKPKEEESWLERAERLARETLTPEQMGLQSEVIDL